MLKVLDAAQKIKLLATEDDEHAIMLKEDNFLKYSKQFIFIFLFIATPILISCFKTFVSSYNTHYRKLSLLFKNVTVGPDGR